MSRLETTFAGLRAAAKPGLVTYVTAGDPTLPKTRGVLQALDRAGADVLEVGVPFSAVSYTHLTLPTILRV